MDNPSVVLRDGFRPCRCRGRTIWREHAQPARHQLPRQKARFLAKKGRGFAVQLSMCRGSAILVCLKPA